MQQLIDQALAENHDKVFFFSKPQCQQCTTLAKDLEELKVPYIQIKLELDNDSSEYLKRKTGMSTYPMIYFGTNPIGSYQKFVRLLTTNSLQQELDPLGIKIDFDF